jgi:hypothetical protein
VNIKKEFMTDEVLKSGLRSFGNTGSMLFRDSENSLDIVENTELLDNAGLDFLRDVATYRDDGVYVRCDD